jgi:hypothetical protein
MALRKPFSRTLPILGTNSANAHQSTGLRTPEGKDRVELNALGHGVGKSLARFFRRSPDALAPWGKQRLAEVSRLCRARMSVPQKAKMEEQSRQLVENKG